VDKWGSLDADRQTFCCKKHLRFFEYYGVCVEGRGLKQCGYFADNGGEEIHFTISSRRLLWTVLNSLFSRVASGPSVVIAYLYKSIDCHDSHVRLTFGVIH